MIKAVFLDIDGVLTDGAVYVDASGVETKKILFDDIVAIFEINRAGIIIGFITGEDNEFCQYVQKRFSPDFFLAGCKNKLEACKSLLEESNLVPSNICYAGDSKKDMELKNYVPLSFSPADVDGKVQSSAKVVLKAGRGQGVIKELVEYIFNKQNQND